MSFSTLPPTGLLCELMSQPDKAEIVVTQPRFCWTINDRASGARQSAYRILVATTVDALSIQRPDMWDSGKVLSCKTIHILYAGKPLLCHTEYFWMVCTWNQRDEVSPWSHPQCFRTGQLTDNYTTAHYPLMQTSIAPVAVIKKGNGHFFFDFGKDAFGTVQIEFSSDVEEQVVEIHLGEALSARHTIDRTPKGCIRYRKIVLQLAKGVSRYTVEIPPDKRNTGKGAIRMPPQIGEVMPFRYCEIVCPRASGGAPLVRQLMAHYPFNDTAAAFESSEPVLNEIWKLCKHSIKATTFCGVYVDGDRERIPYEGDAYINQLGHYCIDREFTLARYSHEYLIRHPTCFTEWIMHSVLMAWADYEYTGNADSLTYFYDDLKAKTLLALARPDGLISTRTGLFTDSIRQSIHYDDERRANHHEDIIDIVDWPPASFTEGGYGERDGYEMVAINTVVNAFHYRAVVLMGRIAAVLGKADEAKLFCMHAERVKFAINDKLFDPDRRIYLDGEGTTHASLHANMFPLAFGLVPAERRESVLSFVKSRGMACSVYGAQYLLEALYRCHEGDYAFALLTSQGERSWWNMIRVGSTITLEAWDWKYKNNLDWNHAWGSAPANIIPRFLMGIRPLEPGFGKVLIHPQPGPLPEAKISLPTISGTVGVHLEQQFGEKIRLFVDLPANMTARVLLPIPGTGNVNVMVDDKRVDPVLTGAFVVVNSVYSGRHIFTLFS